MEKEKTMYTGKCSFSALQRREKWFRLNCNKLHDLKVAAIMDEFTEQCFAPECNLLQLTPTDWRYELVRFQPDLLMVESAWRGKDKLWARKANVPTEEMLGVVEYCNRHGIPTVFWNKEDPVNYEYFISIAWAFDFVFTTDIDSVPRYKRDLGHNNVFFMHFAAQPKIHNPIELYDRKKAFCFAGSYYKKYPERQKDFQVLADTILSNGKLDIYDRNFDRNDPSFEFPDKYKQYILGTLPPEEIDKAYKGYYYNVNMNSVKYSSTMFARRVYELMASNTIVASNYAKGIKTVFGEYVICSDEAEELHSRLKWLESSEENYLKYRLVGLRTVLKQHLYEDRLAYIVDTVFHKQLYYQEPKVTVFSFVDGKEAAKSVIVSFKRQCYENKELVLFADRELCDELKEQAIMIPVSDKEKWLNNNTTETYISFFSAKDYYGENYLTDLMLTFRYAQVEAAAKVERYVFEGNMLLVENSGKAYRFTATVNPTASVFAFEKGAEVLECVTAENFEGKMECNNALGVDQFNYCKNGQCRDCSVTDDIDAGLEAANILELCAKSAGMAPLKEVSATKVLDQQFWFGSPVDYLAVERLQGDRVRLLLAEPDGKYEYLFSKNIDISSAYRYTFSVSGHFDFYASFGCVYYQKDMSRINMQTFRIGVSNVLVIPKDAAWVQIYVKVQGTGKAFVNDLKVLKENV